MLHPRWLAGTGIGLGARAFVARCFVSCFVGCFASCFVGCLNAGQNGDPAPAFSSGSGSGQYGSPGSTYSTTPGRSRGDGGAETRGATDGGALDARAKDAGTNDAGTKDAGTKDAGTKDVGTSADAEVGSRAAACAANATATFSLAWSVEDATGAASTCDGVGGATVDVDVVNLATGAEALSTTPCASLAATTCAMAAGSYSVSLKLRGASGALLAEVFAPQLFLVDGQATGVTSLPLQVGGADAAKGRGFALTWSIDKKNTGALESCAQAGAATVRLLAGTTTFDLKCADGKGRTAAIAPGTYPATLALLDAAGVKLSETQTMSIAIAAGQLVFLGDVPFDVN